MARDRSTSNDYTGPLRRLLLAVLILCLVASSCCGASTARASNGSARRSRPAGAQPRLGHGAGHRAVNLLRDFQSYQRLSEQNQELRRELRQMQAWKEAALQLEQENARLLDLNKVRLDPRLTYITGVVLADQGRPSANRCC